MTLADADFRKSPIKMVYRKLPKTASLPVDSKKRHIEQVDPTTREQAEKRLAEIVRAGKMAVTNQTFKQYGDWWLENCASGEIKESTYEEYSAVLKNLYPIFGPKLISKIKRKDVRQLVAVKRKAGYSRSTIRNILAPMRGMYNQAIDDEELQYNPALNVGRINKRRKTRWRQLGG